MLNFMQEKVNLNKSVLFVFFNNDYIEQCGVELRDHGVTMLSLRCSCSHSL